MSAEFRLRRHIDRKLELIGQSDLEKAHTQQVLYSTAFDVLKLASSLGAVESDEAVQELYRDH